MTKAERLEAIRRRAAAGKVAVGVGSCPIIVAELLDDIDFLLMHVKED